MSPTLSFPSLTATSLPTHTLSTKTCEINALPLYCSTFDSDMKIGVFLIILFSFMMIYIAYGFYKKRQPAMIVPDHIRLVENGRQGDQEIESEARQDEEGRGPEEERRSRERMRRAQEKRWAEGIYVLEKEEQERIEKEERQSQRGRDSFGEPNRAFAVNNEDGDLGNMRWGNLGRRQTN